MPAPVSIVGITPRQARLIRGLLRQSFTCDIHTAAELVELDRQLGASLRSPPSPAAPSAQE